MPGLSTAFLFLKMSVSRIIHIFNPETDIALGSDHHSYTPPAQIRFFRDKLSLLPALFANPGDVILIYPEAFSCRDTLPLYEEALSDGIKIESVTSAADIMRPNDIVIPWGWNRQLRNLLAGYGVNESTLPSLSELENRRDLSHRKTTLAFYSFADKPEWVDFIPAMFTDVDSAMCHIIDIGPCCLKSPWSSSGRGVLFSEGISAENLRNWIHGSIRSQGALLIEKTHDRKMDFASEWNISADSDVSYKGLSIFSTSNRGNYRHNVIADQSVLRQYVIMACGSDGLDAAIEQQCRFIRDHIAPRYQGPLGIDMMVTAQGHIVPCVEINLRNTMGHVAIDIHRRIISDGESRITGLLRHLCRDGIFSTNLLLK